MIKNYIFDFAGVLADFDELSYFDSFDFTPETKKLLAKAMFMCSTFIEYKKGKYSNEEYFDKIIEENPSYEKELRIVQATPCKTILTFKPKMIELLSELKNHGMKIFVMSDSTPDTEKLMRSSEFFNILDGYYFSSDSGYLKTETGSFETLFKEYGLQKQDTILIDDGQKNVNAALNFGINSILFDNEDKIIEQIKNNL